MLSHRVGILVFLVVVASIAPDVEALFYVDPEVNMGPGELIQARGYPYLNYTVQTADGFLLQLHRIPHGIVSGPTDDRTPKPVVYLQHGLMCTSCDWLLNHANQSLGYILADAGFDVWLGDSRGNIYSNRHINYTTSDRRFWQWSWDELALYDLPAFLNFVLNETRAPHLYYVGHSQGTLTAFAGLSKNKALAQKVKAMFALAPVLFTKKTVPIMKIMSGIRGLISSFLNLVTDGQVPAYGKILANSWTPEWTIRMSYHQIVGPDTGKIDDERFNIIIGHYLAGTSVMNLNHFGQLTSLNRFQMYDYGRMDNLKIYKRKTPPRYRMRDFTVPTMLFWGVNDTLSHPDDVRYRLVPRIKNLLASYKYPDTNHVDFVYGRNAAKDYYEKIVSTIRTMEGGTTKRAHTTQESSEVLKKGDN